MPTLKHAGRYWRTMRHLQFRQIAWRTRYALLRRLGRMPRPAMPANAPPWNPRSMSGLAAWADCLRSHVDADIKAAAAVRHGRVTFLSRTQDCSLGYPWDDDSLLPLWCFRLHGFEMLRPLLADDNPEDGARVQNLVHDWIACNPPGGSVAWRPFPTSTRLIYWAMAAAAYGLDDTLLRRSMLQQAAALRTAIEYDVRANHLLRNAVALLTVGKLLDSGVTALGLSILEKEVEEQVLPDGGHFERSPMYHVQVLEDCLAAYAVAGAETEFLRSVIEKMCAFIEGICHPDGEIPLFNDSALGEGWPTLRLVKAARAYLRLPAAAPPQGARAFPDVGYYVLAEEEGPSQIIIKAGAAGARYQPGHAHGDLLSFELSIGTQRIVVDAGVHGYEGSPWRTYCRSTAAHNTVSIDEGEQIECWSTFRVGRRGHAMVGGWRAETPNLLMAAHDAYRPFRHSRGVVWVAELGCWIVADYVDGPAPCTASSCLHFAPDCRLARYAGAWRVKAPGVTATVVPIRMGEVSLAEGTENPQQGWYCPRFGVAVPAPALVMRCTGTPRLDFGYAIFPRDVAHLPEERLAELFAEFPGGTP